MRLNHLLQKALYLILFSYISCSSIFAAVPTSRVIKGIQNRFEQIGDFQANLVQTNRDMNGGKTIYSGKIYFKKPEKIRLNYFSKDTNQLEQEAITDGESLWLYTVSLKQITKQKLDPKSLPLPFLVLGGATQIDESFREKNYIKPIERVKVGKITALEIIVKPKSKKPDYDEQILWVDEKTYLPLKAQIKDTLGNISTVEFSEIQCNKGLPDSIFEMVKKPGISYVELPN